MRQRKLFSLPQNNLKHDTNLEGYWVVSGFDRIALGPVSSKSNFKIDVLFRQLTPGEDPLSSKLTDNYKTLSRPLTTALLWCYGTILKDGNYVGLRSTPKSPLLQRNVSFDTTKDSVRLISRDEKDGFGNLIINTKLTREDKNPPYLGRFLYIQTKKNKDQYVVPCFEVFKAYYAWSRGFVQSILTEYVLTPGTHIFDRSKSDFDTPTRSAYIKLRSHIKNSDARAVCRFFLGAHSEYATARLQSAFNNYVINNNTLSNLVSFPPVEGNETWTCRCIRLPAPSQIKRYLVLQIQECQSDWGVDHLVYSRDNPGNKASDDGSGEEKPGGSTFSEDSDNKPPGGKNSEHGGTVDETNTESPDDDSPEIEAYPENRCTHHNSPIELEDSYPTFNQKKTRTHGPKNRKKPTKGSSTKGNEKDEDVGDLDTNLHEDGDNRDDSECPISPSYYSDLAHLSIRIKTFSISHVKLSTKSFDFDRRLLCHLPTEHSTAAWCFVDKDNNTIRLVEIIQIKVRDQYVYYIELQKRLSHNIGFVIAFKDNLSNFSVEDLESILLGFVKCASLSKKVYKHLDEGVQVSIRKHTNSEYFTRHRRIYKILRETGVQDLEMDAYFDRQNQRENKRSKLITKELNSK